MKLVPLVEFDSEISDLQQVGDTPFGNRKIGVSGPRGAVQSTMRMRPSNSSAARLFSVPAESDMLATAPSSG